MRDIWNEITEWSEGEKPFSIARVIQTWRSAPRSSGAGMIVGEGMEVAGSVSGGCIEGAVIEEALEVLQDGIPDGWIMGLRMNWHFPWGFPAEERFRFLLKSTGRFQKKSKPGKSGRGSGKP